MLHKTLAMKFNLKYKGKKLKIKAKPCRDIFSQGIGLMFKSYQGSEILAFILKEPKELSITTYFCFFPILILFIKNKKVISSKVAEPFILTIKPKGKADTIIEIPLNKKEYQRLKNKNMTINDIKRLEKLR